MSYLYQTRDTVRKQSTNWHIILNRLLLFGNIELRLMNIPYKSVRDHRENITIDF